MVAWKLDYRGIQPTTQSITLCGYRNIAIHAPNPGVTAYLEKLFPKVMAELPGCEIVKYNIQTDHVHMVNDNPAEIFSQYGSR